MGQALYRKYRSKKLSEIIGQEHITSTLDRALQKGGVSHAYLFTGPRGVGKTSIARILAHEVNGFTYDESTHLDIIEIDAASNRRIDEIRNIREHVHSAPSIGKYKVYIIDEVHMLTKEAFNALLKTLEEPPEHVIFILATTEAHKLPDTIISRTQRFNFRPVESEQAISHLKSIADNEGFSIDDEALSLIVDHGQGSFRDSISLLDQVSSGRASVTAENVMNTLGIAPESVINDLIVALETGQTSVVLESIKDLRQAGYHTPQIAKQLSSKLRSQLINQNHLLSREIIINLLKDLIVIPTSHDPNILFELMLINLTPDDSAVKPKKSSKPELSSKETSEYISDERTDKENLQSNEKVEKKSTIKEPSDAQIETIELVDTPKILDESAWQEALTQLKKSHNTLYGIARMANPTFNDGTVTLSFTFAFHQKQFNDTKNKKIVADILETVLNTPIQLVCIIEDKRKQVATSKNKPENIDTISNIFGGAEVLE